MTQKKQFEWFQEWDMVKEKEIFLLKEWIFPHTLENFRGEHILEAGCGGGHHTAMLAPYAKKVTAVDLNTIPLAVEANKQNTNVVFVEADVATMNLGQFDSVIAIGMVHHTDNPDKTAANLARHVKPGGRLILWVYSREGNFLVEHVVEPIRKMLLVHLSRPVLYALSKAITLALYVPVYSVYLLPLPWLPYYQYFQNFRRMSYLRNALNVFDKLNAPQVTLITREQIGRWFSDEDFEDVSITPYVGVSWRGSGKRRGRSNT